MQFTARLIAKFALHTDLTPTEANALSDVALRHQTWKPGAVIADVGDPLDIATVVLDGVLARTKTLPDGRSQILSLLMPGDVIDAHAGVLRRRSDQLIVISPARVAIVPQSRIQALGAEFPRLNEAFLREAFTEAAVAREWVMNAGRRTSAEALAHLLCELQVRFESVGVTDRDGYPFPLTQQHIADCLGISTIHVNRVVQQLRGAGLMRLDRRRLVVLDQAGLRALAKFTPDYLHLDRAKAA